MVGIGVSGNRANYNECVIIILKNWHNVKQIRKEPGQPTVASFPFQSNNILVLPHFLPDHLRGHISDHVCLPPSNMYKFPVFLFLVLCSLKIASIDATKQGHCITNQSQSPSQNIRSLLCLGWTNYLSKYNYEIIFKQCQISPTRTRSRFAQSWQARFQFHIKKSHKRETQNLLTCAYSSKDTKKKLGVRQGSTK